VLVCKDADNTPRWKEGERLDHYFEQRCDELPPDHLAVITEDVSFTYRELDNRANQVARYLLEQGLKAGDRVGVMFHKSIHAYVGVLAVLKIGAAYVPFDASFPTDRISFILEDAGVKAIVSVSGYRAKLAELTARQIFLDTAQEQIDAKSQARLTQGEVGAAVDDVFYIIYTSGTTGKPKGVALLHSGICNFVKVAVEVYGIRPEDRCYQGITLAFDFHVEDLWVPLIAGATLIAGKSGANLFGADLHAFLMKQRVTVLPCVPTLWATIEQDLPDVRIILLSGESVPHHLVVRWHRPGRSILNAYGPTECSVSSTLRILTPENQVTIGRPLPTYMVVILDENKDEVVPDGASGEIGIAGIALAVGYVNREELTRQKFVPDFLNLPNNPSKRIYRTGDLGRIREDGELDFQGRLDTQVKIRGYRIELGEIEAVLSQIPQIAQAVVNPYEAEPGAVELVAYYTRKQGAPEVSPNEISETLRKQLPGYMVPGYLEEMSAIPMTANNKADRKNLPPPRGPRFSVSSSKFVAPRTETEQALAAALGEVMKLDRVSAQDNFFQDLGAHSLLMARFGAEIRKRLKISAVSMQDIYLNPTIEKLARHIDSLPDESMAESMQAPEQGPFHIPSNLAYFGCGALQLMFFLAEGLIGLWLLVVGMQWTFAAMPDLGATYLRILGFALSLAVVLTAIPIALKWLLIGKWKPEVIPVWGLRYFRFWVVKHLIRIAPMARFGGPFYNLYLRLLGAKIGSNTVIHSQLIPVCTDLISIGEDTILRKESIFLGYKAQSNCIHTGPITIGANAFVGEAGILDINTTMEDDTQLGHASSLHDGQRIPRGKHYHGSPAQETTANYCPVEPRSCTPLRRWTYAGVLLAIGVVLMPLPLVVGYALFPHFDEHFGVSEFADVSSGQGLLLLIGKWLLLSFMVFFGGLALALLEIGIVPRLLNLFLRKDRTYVLCGFHYFIHQTIVRLSNSQFFNRLFGDSSAAVQYEQWVGYRLNEIVQTGSNFGMDQRHDNPFLCDIGSGTMVSGGLKMVNEIMSSSSFKLGEVKIGVNTFLGNYLRFPVHAAVGENCLIATKALVPIDGPVRENTGLLGAPSFEIPRAAERDRQLSKMDDETRRQRLREKNRYNLVSAILFLLNNWFIFFTMTLFGIVALLYFPIFDMGAIVGVGAGAAIFLVLWTWLVERGILKFGSLTPQIALVLGEKSYYWFHERHWKLCGLWALEPLLAGTPFKNLLSRAQGVRLGRKVFDDGIHFNEYTLIEIGDYTTLNVGGLIQPHSLEEAVFKSDYVTIGSRCTIGVAANVHYGVTMGDDVVLDPDSFLMKGEIVDSNTTWRGNPARAVYPSVRAAKREPAEALVPVQVP
jgi:non-ribosomal peptide synthetase-like protein